MIHTHPLRGMLSTLLALKKPVTFVTGFVIRIGLFGCIPMIYK
jgi:hypothetical protein